VKSINKLVERAKDNEGEEVELPLKKGLVLSLQPSARKSK
jgi:hypothetical protein